MTSFIDARSTADAWRLNDMRNREIAAKMRHWQIKQSLVAASLGVILTALSYAVAYLMQWDVTFNWLDALAVGTSYACTWLCVVQSRLNYLIGAVSVALYSVVFWLAGLNALAIFNLYLVGSLIYGWFRWGADAKPRLVHSLQPDRWTIGYALIGISITLACQAVNYVYPGTFAPMDILITALSGVAQMLLDNKRLQTWYVWFIVNLLSMYLFFQYGMYIVLLQYVFFTANVFIGHVSWKRSML